LAVSIVLGLGVPLLLTDALSWWVLLTLLLASWIIASHGWDFVKRARRKSLPLAYLGMLLAHLGFAVSLLGVALTSQLSVAKDIRMVVQDSVEIGGVEFRFLGVGQVHGPNYVADQAEFVVIEDGQRFVMRPEKRTYLASGNVMTEAAIDPGLGRDIYLSMGERLEQDAWAVRIQIKPFVRWIWLGGLLMGFGGCLAVLDRRYRRLRQRLDKPQEALATA
jgi:cytochrome c-type biogenesis protein CcmF